MSTSPWAKLMSWMMPYHRVAQGNQGVHTAKNQTVDDLLQQNIHEKNLQIDRLGSSIGLMSEPGLFIR
jgi:hypothetical protein